MVARHLQGLRRRYLLHPALNGYRFPRADRHLLRHCEQTALLALAVGLENGYGESEAQLLFYGGLYHDIGRIGMHECDSDRRLTAREWSIVKRHPARGAAWLADFFLPEVAAFALYHHTMQGDPYPLDLPALDPRLEDIVALVSAADKACAIADKRPYQQGRDFSTESEKLRSEVAPFPACARYLDQALTFSSRGDCRTHSAVRL